VDAFRQDRPADVYALMSPGAQALHPAGRLEAKWKELQVKVGRVVVVRTLLRVPSRTDGVRHRNGRSEGEEARSALTNGTAEPYL
jgi:hypothetical protein